MSIEWLNRLSDRAILLVLLAIALATSGASFVFNVTNEGVRAEWLEGWFQNFSTEMFGAFLGFWLLGIIVDRRRQAEAKQDAREELKKRLIREMGSKDNATALKAVEELRANGWLEDGSLRGLYLPNANLQGADLSDANLYRASLWDSNLEVADLSRASLRGVQLIGANLHGVELADAIFDENTVLPDGTLWTPNTDMGRFLYSLHPDFWRSDEYTSPAYRGDAEDEDKLT